MRGLTNKPVLFPLRLTKKSLVTLNSPPSGRRSTRRGLLAVPMVWPYAYTFFV